MVWYSHLFQNFPQLIVIHTVKGFGIDNKAEIDVFLELFCFFHDPANTSKPAQIGTSLISSGKWQPTPVFLPGESQGRHLWGRTESDTTEATQQQQQQQFLLN